MSRNYKFHNPEGLYFVSFAVVEWLDVFTRNQYKDILIDSLSFYQTNTGMEIVAWCIMPIMYIQYLEVFKEKSQKGYWAILKDLQAKKL